MKNEEVTRPLLVQLGRNVELEELRGCYVHHYPICYRRVLPDATLMSMSSPGPRAEEDWYAISLISYQWPDERAGFFRFADFIGQTAADLFRTRCHWGKYNPLRRDTNERLYPEIEEFRSIQRRFDPEAVFVNDWFREVV